MRHIFHTAAPAPALVISLAFTHSASANGSSTIVSGVIPNGVGSVPKPASVALIALGGLPFTNRRRRHS